MHHPYYHTGTPACQEREPIPDAESRISGRILETENPGDKIREDMLASLIVRETPRLEFPETLAAVQDEMRRLAAPPVSQHIHSHDAKYFHAPRRPGSRFVPPPRRGWVPPSGYVCRGRK